MYSMCVTLCVYMNTFLNAHLLMSLFIGIYCIGCVTKYIFLALLPKISLALLS